MTHTALVTGGNRGIGLAVCAELSRQGYRVLLGARSAERGRAAAAELAAAGQRVEAVPLDVACERSVAALAERIRDRGRKLDCLVNNAAISLPGFDAGVVRQTLAVNFLGALRLTESLLPVLGESSNVVNVSSGMGSLGGFPAAARARFSQAQSQGDLLEVLADFESAVAAGHHAAEGWPSSAYSVSKAALNALTRIWAAERSTPRVNAVCPGWVRTTMGGPAAPRDAAAGARGIVWAATLPRTGPTGGFFRDGEPIAW